MYSNTKEGVLLYCGGARLDLWAAYSGAATQTHLRIPHDIKEGHDVWASGKVLQDLDLPLYLLFLDWFQNLDDALLVVGDVDPFKDLRVLAPSCSLTVSDTVRLGGGARQKS